MSPLTLLFQVAGLMLLLGGIWLGYRRWVAPLGPTLSLSQRGVLLLLIATLAGGLIGSPFWWADEARSFAWDLPPLAGRMLAAAGWSFAWLCFAALSRPTPGRIRLALLMLAVYLAPLAVAILLWHLDRFDFGAPIAYAFFAIVVGLLAPNLFFLARPPQPLPAYGDDSRAPAHPVVRWLEFVALISGLWGLALMITDQGPSPLLWAWPGDLLTSRLIGVMLLTMMAGALYSRRSADLAKVMLQTTVIYAVGIVAASLWGLAQSQPLRPAYALAFAAIALISGLLLRAEYRARAGGK